jgi:hypothetical protein
MVHLPTVCSPPHSERAPDVFESRVARKDCSSFRHRLRLPHYGLGVALWAAAINAAATPASSDSRSDAAPDSMFTFGGFGTLGVVHSDQSLADFTATRTEESGAGHTRSWSPSVDSLIGGQASAQFTSQFSATLQIIAQQNADSSFTPHVERANIKYQLTPDFALHLGRSALSVFLLTDSRNIGFANPWVRPPVELYNIISLTSSDGIGFSYRFGVAGGTNTIDGSAGHASAKFPLAGSSSTSTATADEQLSLIDTYQHGPTTVRVTYGQSHVTIASLAPLFDGFRQFGPQGIAIADRYDLSGRIVLFYGLGAAYEPGDWFLMAEWGHVDTHSALGEKAGWYVSSGRRFGSVTPYATYAQTTSKTNITDPGLDLATLPPSLAGPAAALNAGLRATLAVIADTTISLGARFDVARNIDLKLQADRTRLGPHSQGWLINAQPGFEKGSSYTLVSATVDFVF